MDWNASQLEDLRLWEEWKKSGDKNKLKPLVKNMQPLIYKKANEFSRVQNIPKSAVQAEFKLHAIKGMHNYDPTYKVPLSYHVMRQMDAAKRFVHKYQNVGRIPEHRHRKIGPFKAAHTELENELGRPPTSHELADKLQWPVAEVGRMTQELRDDLLPWKGGGADKAFDQCPPREREVLALLPYELCPEEQAVFEFTYGYGGKPQLGTTEMAKALKYSPAKISRLKARVAKKHRSI